MVSERRRTRRPPDERPDERPDVPVHPLHAPQQVPLPSGMASQRPAHPVDEGNVYTSPFTPAAKEKEAAFVNRIKDLTPEQQQQAISEFETSSAQKAPTISPSRLHKVVAGIPEFVLTYGGLWDYKDKISDRGLVKAGKWLLKKHQEEFIEPWAA